MWYSSGSDCGGEVIRSTRLVIFSQLVGMGIGALGALILTIFLVQSRKKAAGAKGPASGE